MVRKTACSAGTRKGDIFGFIVAAMFFLLIISAAPASTPIFAPAVNYGTGMGPISVAVCDFNGDGAMDTAFANNGAGSISILLGTGNGTFQAAVNYSLGTGVNPDSIICGDFNNDGKVDVATANSATDTISVLLGRGDGTFQAAVNYGTGTSPISIIQGDFNKDGKLDLATANVSADEVSILLGTGDGTFLPAVNYSVGPGINPYSIISADFNGDGKLDLATANSGSNDVSLLLGNGDGTFQAAVTYATGDGLTTGITPLSIITGDFNSDGKRDLATANNGNDISVLLGNGNGTFQAPVIYAAGNGPTAIAAGDFNADGNSDLAVANVLGNDVSVFLGNGNGTFQPGESYAVGNTPYAVGTGDLNNDGKSDVAAANNGSDNASILLSASTSSTYSISGTITSTSGSPVAGVAMTLTGSASASTSTDSSGNYRFPGLMNGTYAVIPGLAGQTFTPANSTVIISSADRPGVNFTINPHTITATATGSGTMTPQGTVTVPYGSSQTFTMNPNAGYKVGAVVVDGISVGEVTLYKFDDVRANHTISVSFMPYNTIYATAETGGTISPSGTVLVNRGSSKTFTITANAGYHIDIVRVDGVSVGAVSSYTLTNVTADHTITAIFAPGTHYELFNNSYGTAGTRLGNCTVCHALHAPTNPSMTNSYGYDILKQRQTGLTKAQALKNVEPLDSDGDRFTNITEIKALKFPGDPLDHP